jgi:hypothetical protein
MHFGMYLVLHFVPVLMINGLQVLYFLWLTIPRLNICLTVVLNYSIVQVRCCAAFMDYLDNTQYLLMLQYVTSVVWSSFLHSICCHKWFILFYTVNRLLSAIFFCLRAFGPCGLVLAIFSIQFSKVIILGDGDLRAASVFDFVSPELLPRCER